MFIARYPNREDTFALLKEAYEPIFGIVVFIGQPGYPSDLSDGDKWVPCKATTAMLPTITLLLQCNSGGRNIGLCAECVTAQGF